MQSEKYLMRTICSVSGGCRCCFFQCQEGEREWKIELGNVANEYQKVNHISSTIFLLFMKWPSLCEMGNCAFMFVLIKFCARKYKKR